MNHADVLIIGGGPAGLSTALGLSRQLHTSIIFDSETYRNDPAKTMHNFPTWDGRNPQEYRKAASEELLSRYSTVQIVKFEIKQVRKLESGEREGFEVSDEGRVHRWAGRKLVLATGSRDILPKIDGFQACWGRSIFHCLFCHGFEDRGAPSVGVLAVSPVANVQFVEHLTLSALQFAASLTIYTHKSEKLAQELQPLIARLHKEKKKNIRIEAREINSFKQVSPSNQNEDDHIGSRTASGVRVVFSSGEESLERFLVYKPMTEQAAPFAAQLGLELDSMGDVTTRQPFYETHTPGIYAVGDCGTMMKSMSYASVMGSFASAGLAGALQSEGARD